MNNKILILFLLLIGTVTVVAQQKPDTNMKENLSKTEKDWADTLSPEQYRVLRQCGTEPPFTGKYYQNKENGNYYCAACGALLFTSKAKYDSGSGWPSFYKEADKTNILEVEDNSLGMHRIEIKCARCGSHLGHVFNDGQQPTGLRFCVNSISLDFKPDEKMGSEK